MRHALRFVRSGLAVLALVASALPAAMAGPLSVRVTTFNVDFTNTAQQIHNDIVAVRPKSDIIMFQEAKWVNVADSFGSGFTVYQVTDEGDAKAGSALAIRNSIINSVLATGLELGVDASGVAMLDRYIAWADIELTNGQKTRVMSLHMPPQRYAQKQPIMAANLVSFANSSPYPVIVGGDWNFTVVNDPHNIEGGAGLKPRGVGIDGFFYDEKIVEFISRSALSGLGVNSDHDPVRMITNIHPVRYFIDNTSPGFSASSNWDTGTSAADKYGSNYRFRNTQAVNDAATWTTTVYPGVYRIHAWWSQGSNRSPAAPYVLPNNNTVTVNQQTNGGTWNMLGQQSLGANPVVKLSCWTGTGYVVIADGIRLTRQ